MMNGLLLLGQVHAPAAPLGISMSYWVILGAFMLLGMLVSGRLRSKFSEYSQIPVPATGREVAEAMLRQNGITDVSVISTPGQLTDHYDPSNRTVNLSEQVYHVNSVAAAAVAAHECGHAVQHAQAYKWLTLRTKMVPAVQFSSRLMPWLFVGAFGFGVGGGSTLMLQLAVATFAVTTLFAIVTLPVEFDASRRALVWLEKSGMAGRMEHDRAKDALFWAAMTYVVAALSSLVMLIYYLMLLSGRRE
jgi:Zn-dependent membrane protease YugP